MKVLLRVVFVIACFFAAVACWQFGVPIGGGLFIVLGLVFEGLFWTGIFGRKKKTLDAPQ
ncbi:hypothetical protein [Gilvimarinus algae]|uniref:Phosphatidate cytidylyltransferase n=1 Tax=Gilvimarinus algae TaxID=3058037 RepID=A0ABT8TEN6_9GAMM|nr:hypothetical protein [Gilvimarinus sp. SDUM040014]MDO3381131.1 hypothetical protein [Gilvimarinus sp. SDUM040014]